MTHDEATTLAAERNRDDERHWMVRETADGWEAVRTSLPNRGPVHETTSEETEAPSLADKRSIVARQVGGGYV